MKVITITVDMLVIEPDPASRLDPIRLQLEDIGPGRGRITVVCFDRAWTAYWGAMGGTLREFLCHHVSASYIADNLVRGVRGRITKLDMVKNEERYLLRIAEAIQAGLRQEEANTERWNTCTPPRRGAYKVRSVGKTATGWRYWNGKQWSTRAGSRSWCLERLKQLDSRINFTNRKHAPVEWWGKAP